MKLYLFSNVNKMRWCLIIMQFFFLKNGKYIFYFTVILNGNKSLIIINKIYKGFSFTTFQIIIFLYFLIIFLINTKWTMWYITKNNIMVWVHFLF